MSGPNDFGNYYCSRSQGVADADIVVSDQNQFRIYGNCKMCSVSEGVAGGLWWAVDASAQ